MIVRQCQSAGDHGKKHRAQSRPVQPSILLQMCWRHDFLRYVEGNGGKLTFAHDTFVAVFCWLRERNYVFELAWETRRQPCWGSAMRRSVESISSAPGCDAATKTTEDKFVRL
jgi:hypothetical protein